MGDFARTVQKSCNRVTSGEDTQLFSSLNRLRATFGVELFKQSPRVRLDRVFADVDPLGDLPIAESFRDQFEDFEFARRQSCGRQAGGIAGESGRLRCAKFFDDNCLRFLREGQPQPDAEDDEDYGNQSAVEFKRMFEDDVAILDALEQQGECSSNEAEHQDGARN